MTNRFNQLSPFRFAKKYPFWPYLKRYPKRYSIGLLTLALVDLVNVSLPLFVKYAIDAIEPKNLHKLIWASVGYLILMILQSYGRYLWRIYLMGTSHLVVREVRQKVYCHLQKLPLEFHQKNPSGDLMSRVTNDIEAVRMALGPGILVTADAILMLILIIPPMLLLSPKLSLLAFAFYPLVPWITKRIGTKIDLIFEELQKKMSGLSSYAQESFSGVRLIRSLVLESETCREFRKLSEKYREQGINLAGWESIFSPSLGLLTNAGTFLILWLGGIDVIQGAITVGTFVAFQRFVVQLSWPMEAIGWAVTMHREGFAAQRRIDQIFEVSQISSVLKAETRALPPSPGQLEIRSLDFRYPTWEKQHPFSLKLRDLRVQRGQKIGIVGRVGSGKTTFLNLWLRLYETNPNSLFFEGRDIASIPLAILRKEISLVEQSVFLFSENVINNMKMGNQKLSQDQVGFLMKLAQIEREVSELPKGYETPLGEKGVTLSGGQKQRLALVRALLREPKVLLLDDCFSAVDVEVESRIIDSFFEQYQPLTVLFASHRLSVMSRMDEIWVLDQGSLVERGTHQHLLQISPLYQDLWSQSERELDREKIGIPHSESFL
ncbi:MAG: ABC transporter ATP-binding protein [Deltaproteobacteria bacterium]